jgi:hypothetical protein
MKCEEVVVLEKELVLRRDFGKWQVRALRACSLQEKEGEVAP